MSVVNKIILKPHERIVRVYRRYPIVDIRRYVIAAALMLIPFFFLFPLMRLKEWGMALGSIIFLAGFFELVRTLFMWIHNVFIITTDRIIDFDQRGLFERVVSQSSYEKIQDVSFHIHGPLQTMFRYGDVNIKTGWGSVDLCVPGIFQPERAQRLLIDTQEDYMVRTNSSIDNRKKYGSSTETETADTE